MKKIVLAASFAALLLAAKSNFEPGKRTIVLAHNAFPDHGKYGDRLDRVIGTGQPFAVEEDLGWVEGKSLLIHGPKAVGQDDPTLESYFFPRIKPVMEKALKENKKDKWPLVTLYLDIKNDPMEHLEAIAATLSKYDAWITTATKTADGTSPAPLDLKPMLVLVEEKQKDIKRQFFYDRVAVGGKVHVFGSATKPDVNPDKKLSKMEAVMAMGEMKPEQVITEKADAYRRWIGFDWAFIEKGGQSKAGEWTAEKDARLHEFVNYGHKMGYLVSFYALNGYTDAENQGWDKDYNFGSKEAVMPRWKAAAKAKADFISTDQYEDVVKVIAAER